MASFYVCRRNSGECKDCGFCIEYFSCPGVGKPSIDRFETACIDCGVCLVACPYGAVERVVDMVPRRQVTIMVDGQRFSVPERVTVKRALELLGLEFGKFPGDLGFLLLVGLGVVLPVLWWLMGRLGLLVLLVFGMVWLLA